MLRTDNYTRKMLDLARRVHVLDLERGYFEVDGFGCRVDGDNPTKCECDEFRGNGECIHVDAVAFALDSGPVVG